MYRGNIPYEHLNFDNLYRPYFLYPPTHHTHKHTHTHTHTHIYIYIYIYI